MLPLLLLLAAAADQPEAAPSYDGGVCAGLSWVRLADGEKAFIERGPDFDVLRFVSDKDPAKRSWGVYSGSFAQVRGNGPLLLKRDGVEVHRAAEDGQFRGYLAEKDRSQNHFFGAIFDGTANDKRFFDRIDFSPTGRALCAKGR